MSRRVGRVVSRRVMSRRSCRPGRVKSRCRVVSRSILILIQKCDPYLKLNLSPSFNLNSKFNPNPILNLNLDLRFSITLNLTFNLTPNLHLNSNLNLHLQISF